MDKKFAIVPGYVISINDGDRHWITAQQLIQLYGVNPKECLIITNSYQDGGPQFIPDNLIILTVRYNGDYKEYLAEQLKK